MFVYDLPAFSKFIQERSEYAKIGVIGHSLGAIVAVNGLALLPDELSKYIEIAALFGCPGGLLTPKSYYI